MDKSKIFTNIVTTIFFSVIISALIYNSLIYPTIIPVVKDGTIVLFRDWQIVVIANICDGKGYDVFIENPCDFWKSKHVYGKILLKLPLVEKNLYFYFAVFPVILNVVFLYLSVSFFLINKKLTNILYAFIFILSAAFILIIERANIDIIIFLFIFLIAKYKNLILNHFVVIFTTMIKFYPIALMGIFLMTKKIKNILINLLISTFTVAILIFLQKESLLKIINNKLQFTGSGVYGFSIFNFFRPLNGDNYYIFLTLFGIFCFLIYFYRNCFFSVDKKFFFLKKNEFENRLFFLSSLIILTCYFAFTNFFYREIFLLGLLPYLFLNLHNGQEKQLTKLILFFLSFKFLFTTIFVIIERNQLVSSSYNKLITLTKHSIDLFLIILLGYIFITNLYVFVKEKFNYSNQA
tara:strand:+ start:288 stop:1508 length:1221 start_codon:yes stop_codon:yes gene_type:complete